MNRIKNDLVQWFVKNVLVPSFSRYDIPGFVVNVKNARGLTINQRNVFVSESLLAEFEKGLVKEFGEKGKKMAYTIGKTHGFAYSSSFDVPQLTDGNERIIDDFVPFFAAFMGATWGSSPKYTYDIKAKVLDGDLEDHVVCRKNGLGYMLTAGALGGGWQYIFRDDTIEGVQAECVGRGGEKCRILCGPATYLKEKGYPPIEFTASTRFPIDATYLEMNRVRPLRFSKASMKGMIGANIFRFEANRVTFHEERYLHVGIELMYVIEREARKNDKIGRILYKVAFEQGRIVASHEKEDNDYSVFIPDFLAALGFGDTLISQERGKFSCEATYFPWLQPYAEVNYYYYKGFVSGMLSGFTGKRIVLEKHSTDVSGGNLKLSVW